MNNDVIEAAKQWVLAKLAREFFQEHDNWYNWDYEGTSYDINMYTDFHTGKTGATLYPLKRASAMNLHETDTHKGVRLL